MVLTGKKVATPHFRCQKKCARGPALRQVRAKSEEIHEKRFRLRLFKIRDARLPALNSQQERETAKGVRASVHKRPLVEDYESSLDNLKVVLANANLGYICCIINLCLQLDV